MISVIVISYEASDVLRRCLASVEALAESGNEVWVVDNASSDGSAELVRSEFPFARLLALEKNVGFGTANNRAAREAAGEALLLLNPDAWLEEGCAERLLEALGSQESLGLASPTIRYPDGGRQFNWSPTSGFLGEGLQTARNGLESWGVVHRPCARLLRLLGNRGWFSASCCMVRRSAFEEISGFDERFFLYFEDVDLCVRLAQAGWGLKHVPNAVASHDRGAITSARSDMVPYRRSQFLYYEKHRPAWENRTLLKKQKRQFEREPDPDYRRRLLEAWREASARLER